MAEIKKAVILAAGRGTRMRELTSSIPKPMIEVRGEPILRHIVDGLSAAGVREVLIVVGYRADVVKDYFGDGRELGVAISYAAQVVQDGTGRVVELAREFVAKKPFILHYGDILVDPLNYQRLVDLPDEIEAIVTVKAGEDCSKGGAVFVDEQMKVTDVQEKAQRSKLTSRWYNAGIYVFRPAIFKYTARLQSSARGEYELTDAIREMAQSANVVAFELQGSWADVRDPEVLAALNAESSD
ncbi:MAG: nucleotidyltransferase family protein [Verrucomicrobia bacterium]|nr:nucleotidyltransferase family protein [Verrucomicrobiota bacterium]